MSKRDRAQTMMLAKYTAGFTICLLLTAAMYVLVTSGLLNGTPLVVVIGGLALIQMIVQLVFFLHVAHESRPRFKLFSFSFMAIILVIIVAGSLWIMYHLNYNMMDMSPNDKDMYMTGQKDKGF